MKALMRVLGLAAVLVVTALSSGNTSTLGLCKTRCAPGFILVQWQAGSYHECCQGSVDVCPPGTTAVGANYTPPNGPAVKCDFIG
jgi:hypothetical protein